ncbi:MAG TPA: F0F1 ATP synthase subunit epsilon, partial [Streptosporangiaceae bacterium]
IGVLTGHTPVLGILATGSLVRILPGETGGGSGWVEAAVAGGFLSVADDRVAILARQAALGADVDKPAVRSALDTAKGETGGMDAEDAQEAEARVAYLEAQLRAAGETV